MNRTVLIVGGSVAGLLVVALGGVVAVASMQPDTIHVERTLVVAATPADIQPHVHDFDKYVQWNPWSALDPAAEREISDPSSGVGATYAWSGNDQVGTGSMKNLKVEAGYVEQSLVFTEPWQSSATIGTTLAAEGEGTRVTWSMDQPSDFMMKTMTGLGVMDMDAMLGADFERGLQNLKAKAEADAVARVEAEKAAEAERLAIEAADAEGEGEGESAGGPEGDAPEGGTPPD